MARIARWIGATEGQVWTLVVAMLVALLGVGGMTSAISGDTTVMAAPQTGDAAPPVGEQPSATEETPERGVTDGPPDAGAPQVPVVVLDPASGARPTETGTEPIQTPTAPNSPPPASGTVATFTPIGNVPAGLAVAASGRVFVGTNGSAASVAPTVEVFDEDGTFVASHELADVERIAGLASDGETVWIVSTAPTAALIELDTATGRAITLAVVPDLPPCVPILQAEPCEDGLPGGAPEPVDVALAASGLLVSDVGQGVIFEVGRDGSVAVWAKGFRADPTVRGGPTGLARQGTRLLAVTRTTGPSGDDAAVVEIPITAGGLPGASRTLTTLSIEDAPVDVVGVGSGFAVSLSAAGTVARYSADATQVDQWGDGSMDTPLWLAHADTVLVTDSSAKRVVSIVP